MLGSQGGGMAASLAVWKPVFCGVNGDFDGVDGDFDGHEGEGTVAFANSLSRPRCRTYHDDVL